GEERMRHVVEDDARVVLHAGAEQDLDVALARLGRHAVDAEAQRHLIAPRGIVEELAGAGDALPFAQGLVPQGGAVAGALGAAGGVAGATRREMAVLGAGVREAIGHAVSPSKNGTLFQL